MAFHVPDHLPRKPLPTDVSSQILATISKATNKSLTAELAAGWVSELECSIRQTKDRIHDRIYEELPDFERQLDTSKSVQTRLQNLSSNVDKLANSLENGDTGLLPTLLKSLRAHRELAQRALDARVTLEALSYLNECRRNFESLATLVGDGHLPEGVELSGQLHRMLEGAPGPVAKADIMIDMKNQLRTLKDRMEEQLNEAYSRAIQVSSTKLRISPSVNVRQSQTIITLHDILASISSISLSSLLTTLRRDIVAHFIEFPLQQAVSSNISRAPDANGTPSISLSIFPSIFPLPPSPNFRKSTPEYLRTLFDFLRDNLYLALPPPAASSFPQSFYNPTTSTLLRDVLVPSIPSSLSDLYPFLSLVQDTVRFEQEYFFSKPDSADDGDILAWAKGVAGHYGRKRRVDLLAEARKLILSTRDDRTVRVEASQPTEKDLAARVPDVIPIQGEIGGGDEAEISWDFDNDDVPNGDSTNGKPTHEESGAGENGWDFDDVDNNASDQTKAEDEVQDDADAWGWGDEENGTLAASEDDNTTKSTQPTNGHKIEVDEPPKQVDPDDSAWDSVWDEPRPAPPSPPSPVQLASPAKAPKVAKRLEKLSAKGKGRGLNSPALSSNPPSSTFSASSTFPSSVSSTSQSFVSTRPESSFSTSSPHSLRAVYSPPSEPRVAHSKPPALTLPQKPQEPETYLISGRVQDLIRLVSHILSEGGAIAASSVFSDFPLSSPESTRYASTLVLQVAPATLDLYRAVYPVAFARELTRSARALRFANDCLYLHEEVAKLDLPVGTADAVHDQMREALERLHALGTWWTDEGIERECERVVQILSRAEGFVDTSDQERFDECESVMSEVLRHVRTATGEWKTVLPHMKWLRATGRVVETSLTRVLDDVLALPDIPEVDSRRLSELCRILNSLEGLFVDAEDPEAPSMVVDYVPSWLKYSYLSELLEASIADISYLFDEGALIDFSVDELVRLVRALFADTSLRANTIAKLQRGHPVPVE